MSRRNEAVLVIFGPTAFSLRQMQHKSGIVTVTATYSHWHPNHSKAPSSRKPPRPRQLPILANISFSALECRITVYPWSQWTGIWRIQSLEIFNLYRNFLWEFPIGNVYWNFAKKMSIILHTHTELATANITMLQPNIYNQQHYILDELLKWFPHRDHELQRLRPVWHIVCCLNQDHLNNDKRWYDQKEFTRWNMHASTHWESITASHILFLTDKSQSFGTGNS